MGLEVPTLDHEIECQARLNIADNFIALGRHDEAEPHFDVVQRVVDDDREAELWAKWRYRQHHAASVGTLRLLQGRPDDAVAWADECIAWADRYQSVKNLAKGWRLRGESLRALGRDDEASAALDTALTHADATGNPTQRWLCLAALGRYGDALGIIEAVAARLAPERGQRMLAAREVEAIRAKVGA
jgi:tetratricopeptide (TPR) repeat protein